jgi:uncharacterized membrane protein YidH (DUF202 family)
MTPNPGHVFDPSTPYERTTLAWERTAIALMVAGALMLKHATDTQTAWAEAVGVLVIASGAVTLFWSSRQHDPPESVSASGANLTHPRILRALTTATIALSFGSLLLVLLGTRA